MKPTLNSRTSHPNIEQYIGLDCGVRFLCCLSDARENAARVAPELGEAVPWEHRLWAELEVRAGTAARLVGSMTQHVVPLK